MNNPNTKGAVERVARIIDPSSWRVMDSYLAEMQRKYKGQDAAYDPDAFKDKASLAKAEAILATLNLGELVTALEEIGDPERHKIISGSPGPLYTAGWDGAVAHLAERINTALAHFRGGVSG